MNIRSILLDLDQLVAFYKREMPQVQRIVVDESKYKAISSAVQNKSTRQVTVRDGSMYYRDFRLVRL